VAAGYIDGAKLDAAFSATKEETKGSDTSGVDKITILLIKEVLESMGRSKDSETVLATLQAHLINSNDDILSLTKAYCVEIGLPWGLILALKSKIRSYNIQLGDAWSIHNTTNAVKDSKEGYLHRVSLSAPHIAKNQEKINLVVRSSSSVPQIDTDDSASTRTPRSEFNASAKKNEFEHVTRLFEEHQKSVKGEVDECRQFVMQSMDRIMGTLEQRLKEAEPGFDQRPAARYPSTSAGLTTDAHSTLDVSKPDM
jgi:hypothetical protein